MSKHSELKDFLYELSANKVPAYIIALQETWTIHHPHLINIPGYKFIHQHRKDMKGGGVGFYVKENLSFKVSEKHTTFIPKIFECLSIEISISNKKNIFSSIYRSPSSKAEDFHAFIAHLDSLLFNLASNNTPAYICLDSNINLLNMCSSHTHFPYLSTINDSSFIQCIEKATRVHNQ